ncbi:uncharacterized protein B0H18DRAFT_1018488 [Fomitopsis serialis]|uniref:uncharacterized protein n=1 Tax=Fomitopsis serialis TaxID=139415 RepID=UPI002007472F|nr:uncharacterized protein B0H18DRAFT_1018488 [Neoantrodia serialis]KAH9922200.1 hypothetical protein B0H18DRAFT_1018488 [Neoantrodia serialis]
MATALRLPPGLLDLTLSRVFARTPIASVRPWRGCETVLRRHGHSAAVLLQQSPADYDYDALSLYSAKGEGTDRTKQSTEVSFQEEFHNQNRALSELEERVRALQEAVKDQTALTDSASYSEEDLLQVYEDVLALPPSMPSEQDKAVEPRDIAVEDAALLQGIAMRWLEGLDSPASSSTTDVSVPRSIIARLREVAAGLERLDQPLPQREGEESNVDEIALSVPTGMLTTEEWLALIRTFFRTDDSATAETALSLMKSTGGLGLEEAVNEVLASYASVGDVTSTERVLQAHAPSPTEVQRDFHIKAYCKALAPGALPLRVEELLHEYESRGLPAPMKSYTRVLTALLSSRTRPSLGHAQAWDLFAHMRYAVHPEPDIALYTLMLRSCAHPAMPAEPERALDLFTEATVDHRLAPTPAAFSAAIYALSRSGEKRYIREAFRLAKQMVDGDRDARGMSAFRPDRRLVDALLEGAKRIGDLARTRWLLAVMVRQTTQAAAHAAEDAGGRNAPESWHMLLNEGIMRHVFHTYASYKVPFTPSLAKIVEEPDARTTPNEANLSESENKDASETSAAEAATDMEEDFASSGLPVQEDMSSFSHIPPQSRAEVAREVDILFSRIVEDNRLKHDLAERFDFGQEEPTLSPGPFQHIALTTRLLNAYLSVHYVHSRFEVWGELYRTLFDQLNVPRDAKTYVEALERCSTSHRSERHLALRLAEEIWGSWQSIEGAWSVGGVSDRNDPAVSTLNARLIERANVAMIRILSLTGQARRALDVVQSFAARYPPGRLLRVEPKHPLRSSRSVLEGARPLVRLSSSVDIPDDTVPPLLTFTDLEVLHSRLVRSDDKASIRYVKWLCKTYEGYLRRRRDAAMFVAPPKQRPGAVPTSAQ